MPELLDDEQVERYEANGYLVVPGFADLAGCRELRQRASEIVAAFDPGAHRSIFTTDDQSRVSDQEFFDSAAGVHCFFEEDAFDDAGALVQDKDLSINKIGHAMHDLDPVFERFSYTDDLAHVAHDLGLADPLALQSMYIFKQPHIGGEVSCHQDSTFLFTDPMTVTGFWFAIEDATVDNGCLWAAPGGHRTALRRQFRRTAEGVGTTFVDLDPTPLPTPPGDLVPLEVGAGTLVVLHGLLPHWSDVNRSPTSRHAYSLHCISAAADYPSWNWLQRRPTLPLRRLDAGVAT